MTEGQALLRTGAQVGCQAVVAAHAQGLASSAQSRAATGAPTIANQSSAWWTNAAPTAHACVRAHVHAQGLASSALSSPKGAKVLVAELEGVDAKAMQEAAQKLLQVGSCALSGAGAYGCRRGPG